MAVFWLLLAIALLNCQSASAIAECNRIDTKFGRAYCPNDFYDLSSIWFYEFAVTASAPGINSASLYGMFAGVSASYLQSVTDSKCPNLNPPSFDTTNIAAFDCYGDTVTAQQAYAVGRTTHQTWTISNLSGVNTITIVFPDRDGVPSLVANVICDPNAPRYVLNFTAQTFTPTNKWVVSVYTQAACQPVAPCGVPVNSAVAGPWPMFQASRGRAGQTTLVGPSTCHVAWRTFVGGPLTGSPIVGPNYKIYVGTANHFVFALGRNGQPRFRKQTAGAVQTPTVALASPFFSSNITVYVPTLNMLLALDPDTGVVVWNVTHPDVNALCTTPAFSDFNFYYTGLYFTCGTTLYSVNAARGRVEWTYTAPSGSSVLSGVAMDPVNGTVYVGSNKGLFGLSADGQSVFNFTDVGVLGLPTVSNHGNSIFFNGVDNQTYAVDAHSGLLIWSYPVSGSLSSAAIGPNCTLFLGSFDGKVFAIDAHTGFVLWQFQTGGRVDSSPAVDAANTVYIGSYDHKLYALDGATGVVRWVLKTNSEIIASPAITEDGNVLIGTTNGYVYSITGDSSAVPCPSA